MQQADSTSLVVNIHGKSFTIVLEPGQSADEVRQVAQLVSDSVRQVEENYHPPSPVQTAVLAALNLVDELLQLRRDYQAAESDIAQRASRLSASLGSLFDRPNVGALSADDA